LYKTAISARDQHVLSFSHGADHFLTVSKVHEFVHNTSFQPEMSTFWHFPTEHTHFCHFRKGYTTFKRFSAKTLHAFAQNSEFSSRSARFLLSALGEPLFSHFYEIARVCAKIGFLARDQHFLSFLHLVHQFSAIFSKVY